MMTYEEIQSLVKGDLIQHDKTKQFRVIHRSASPRGNWGRYVVMNPATGHKHGVVMLKDLRDHWTKLIANTEAAKALYGK